MSQPIETIIILDSDDEKQIVGDEEVESDFEEEEQQKILTPVKEPEVVPKSPTPAKETPVREDVKISVDNNSQQIYPPALKNYHPSKFSTPSGSNSRKLNMQNKKPWHKAYDQFFKTDEEFLLHCNTSNNDKMQ